MKWAKLYSVDWLVNNFYDYKKTVHLIFKQI